MTDTQRVEYKLIFTGPMGAGKTTAIGSVSEIPPVLTDVANTDKLTSQKESTTVALDYGEITLAGGSRLRLYGTPGQERFEYMWRILAQGAVGVVILIDNSRPDPISDFRLFAERFGKVVGETRMVVGIGRSEHDNSPAVGEFNRVAGELGLALPIVTADVRNRSEVLMLLEILFSQVEVAELLGSSA